MEEARLRHLPDGQSRAAPTRDRFRLELPYQCAMCVHDLRLLAWTIGAVDVDTGSRDRYRFRLSRILDSTIRYPLTILRDHGAHMIPPSSTT